MVFTAIQIAQMIKGTVEGKPEASVDSFGKIEEATAGQLSFLANPKYEEHLYKTSASIVIINENLVLKHPVTACLIRVENAYNAFALLLSMYQKLQLQQLEGVQELAFIDPSSKIGTGVYVGQFSFIGRNCTIADDVKVYPQVFIGDHVTIGKGTILHPGAKVYNQCIIGQNCVIHAGTVIGADGFGFAPQADGSYQKVPQIGNVIIEDNVEIGANTSIDRATIGSTIIKTGVKIDNLVQIAHNVEVGSNTVIAAQVGISGSTKLGVGVMIGGQAGIVGHIALGDGSKVNAQSGVSKSLEPGVSVTGSPAYNYTLALRSQAIARRLPELEQRIKMLETKLAATEKISAED